MRFIFQSLKYLGIILGIMGGLFLGALVFTPKPSLLGKVSFSQAVYDNQQHLLYLTLTPDQQYRLYTPLSKIPANLIKATLLQEDQYYYFHPGVNPVALIKAFIESYILHHRKLGASTITMQVVRMENKLNTRTISGKLIQIFYALQLECYYSKQQILEAYLNLAPYGSNIEGAGAASLIYFKKPLQNLNFSEILTLVVIPQNPIKRSPTLFQHQQLFHARYDLFLRFREKYPHIFNSNQYQNHQTLMQLPLPLETIHHMLFSEASHFIIDVLAHYPHQAILHTTLDLTLQHIIAQTAEAYIKTHMLYNYAVLLVDSRDMSVKAMIGSADFFNPHIEGQINGTQAERSPGSALKPFIYALALEQGLIHPMSILKDAPTHFGLYSPENFDKDYIGPVNATTALITSRNIPAVALMEMLHHPDFYQFLQQAGIRALQPEFHYGLSLALGGEDITMQEMVKLYAMLINKGKLKPLRFLSTEPSIPGKQLLTPEACFLVLEMLKSNPRLDIISTAAEIPTLPVYWKTGTSSRFRDAWSVGIVGTYVLAVWTGDFGNKTHQQFIGLKTAAPLFFNIIDAIQTQAPQLKDIRQNPAHLNLVRIKVCEASGLLPTAACPKTVETWFIPGISPIKKDNIFKEILINTHTGLRACHVSSATQFKVYEFWPSDLEALFEKAGIHHLSPPPYEAKCHLQIQTDEGLPPQIISPREDLVYTLHLNNTENNAIPFIAIAEDDVKTLYWFINQTYIGQSAPNQALSWKAQTGNYTLRVVDDRGRSDKIPLKIGLVH